MKSHAGVVADSRRWLAALGRDAAYRGALFCVAAGLIPFADEQGHSGPGIARLATQVGKNPKRVRRHLEQLNADGWLTVVRRGGGRGKPTVFALAMPALLRRDEVSETRSLLPPFPAETGLAGTQFDPETGAVRTQFRSERGSEEPQFLGETGSLGARFGPETGVAGTRFGSPPYPPSHKRDGDRDGEGTPLPPTTAPPKTGPQGPPLLASAHARWQAEAEELVDRLPVQLRPIAAGYRAELVDLAAGKLTAGWPTGELHRRASQAPLPDRVEHPLGFLRHRWQGMPPAPAAATPAPSSVRDVLGVDGAQPASPEFVTATAADLRRELQVRRSS